MTRNPYSTTLNPSRAPQSEPIPGREADMVKNRAGGHVFTLSPWSQLTRFLILGAEGSTYYASEREMILDNARALQHCIAEDGVRTVSHIAEIDAANRAPKRGPLLFALGAVLARGSDAAKAAVVDAVPSIVRTASDLFQLLSILADLKGRPVAGRSVRRMIEGWYNGKTPSALAYQMAKYRNRSGFTHRDAIRLAHPTPSSAEHAALLRWATKDDAPLPGEGYARIVHGFVRAQEVDDPKTAARIIVDYGLTWEMVKPEHLSSPAVWEALLPNLPYRALLRNLGRMGSIGFLRPLSGAASTIAERLVDVEDLRRSRVHPIAVLSALTTYRGGEGIRGSLTWNPVDEVVNALETAFEGSFQTVKPTGRRYYLGVDVSGSMDGGMIAGVPGLTPRMGAAALAMVTARTEKRHVIKGFTSGSGMSRFYRSQTTMVDLPFTAHSSFSDALRATSGIPFGGTDCSLPMLDALDSGLEVDVFVILTDNETWAGRMHPSVALGEYRKEMGINAKLIVVGMTSTGHSIADPEDPGMLDVVGFDTAAPEVMRAFAVGGV